MRETEREREKGERGENNRQTDRQRERHRRETDRGEIDRQTHRDQSTEKRWDERLYIYTNLIKHSHFFKICFF